MAKKQNNKEEKKEYYSVYVDCWNCNDSEVNEIKIPKGQKVEDTPCPNCGCNNLHKR